MKKITNKKIAEKLGCHIDTIFRFKRRATYPSREMAKKCEQEFGIDRIKFLYPEEYGDPWKELKNSS